MFLSTTKTIPPLAQYVSILSKNTEPHRVEYKKWEDLEKDWLSRNYKYKGRKFCAEHLGRSTDSILQMAKKLGCIKSHYSTKNAA